mmetsp:Transcript_64127/g.101763  ORF Transcript_64127/g.101763 Transcript_64127/m.101763 type:complete len:168 (+) Transcript_64127:57-560(+)
MGSTEVEITKMSGEVIKIPNVQQSDTVLELRQMLQEAHPSPQFTIYRILKDAEVLNDEDNVLSNGSKFMAVVKPDLIKTLAGKWKKLSGDHYFIGLEIFPDGTYHCNSGSVTDGLVRQIQDPPEGKLNLRRTVADANDHNFDVDETGRKMTGHCPQSGCRWELEKED